MFEELNQDIAEYRKKWQEFTAIRQNKAFFEGLKPSSAAWKCQDFDDFDRRFAEMRGHADHIHVVWLNERWLATFHLRNDVRLDWDMELAVLMQRRPGSKDAVGLDHLDFRSPPLDEAEKILQAESNIKWTREKNGKYCDWLSIWFAGTEAKLRPFTKLDVGISEMQEISDRMSSKDHGQ